MRGEGKGRNRRGRWDREIGEERWGYYREEGWGYWGERSGEIRGRVVGVLVVVRTGFLEEGRVGVGGEMSVEAGVWIWLRGSVFRLGVGRDYSE